MDRPTKIQELIKYYHLMIAVLGPLCVGSLIGSGTILDKSVSPEGTDNLILLAYALLALFALCLIFLVIFIVKLSDAVNELDE